MLEERKRRGAEVVAVLHPLVNHWDSIALRLAVLSLVLSAQRLSSTVQFLLRDHSVSFTSVSVLSLALLSVSHFSLP